MNTLNFLRKSHNIIVPDNTIRYAEPHIKNTAITSQSIKSALRKLETDLLSIGLISSVDRNASKIKALYPFAGGSAEAHSFNFIDNSKYKIKWFNNPNHNENGVQFNGVNQYGDTNFMPHPLLHKDNTHLSFYADTEELDPNRSGQRVIGSTNGPTEDFSLAVNRGNIDYYCSTNNDAIALTSYPAPRKGLIMGCRTSKSLCTLYKNGQVSSRSTVEDRGTLSGVLPVVIGQCSFPYEYSKVPCSFASVGESFTDDEVVLFTNAVQSFQSSLNRAR